jgi:hypothetical protein
MSNFTLICLRASDIYNDRGELIADDYVEIQFFRQDEMHNAVLIWTEAEFYGRFMSVDFLVDGVPEKDMNPDELVKWDFLFNQQQKLFVLMTRQKEAEDLMEAAKAEDELIAEKLLLAENNYKTALLNYHKLQIKLGLM